MLSLQSPIFWGSLSLSAWGKREQSGRPAGGLETTWRASNASALPGAADHYRLSAAFVSLAPLFASTNRLLPTREGASPFHARRGELHDKGGQSCIWKCLFPGRRGRGGRVVVVEKERGAAQREARAHSRFRAPAPAAANTTAPFFFLNPRQAGPGGRKKERVSVCGDQGERSGVQG